MTRTSRLAVSAGAFLFAATLSAAPPRSHFSGSHGGSGSRMSGPSRGSHFRSGWGGGWHGGFRDGFRHRVFIGGGLGWGWGWGWGWWGYPGYYGPYGYGEPYGYGAYATAEWAVIDTDVSPEEARVYLDGQYIGTADDFDGSPDYLYLKPGRYKLEFRLEGFESRTIDVRARAGAKVDIKEKLPKIPGAKQYGSYDTPQPEGGIHRYWGKDKDQTRPYDGDSDWDEPAGPRSDRRDHDRDRSPRDSSGEWRDRDRSPDASPAPSEPDTEESAPDSTVSTPPTASVRPAAGKARLILRAEPRDAAVYVDDRFMGTAEELSSLSRGLQLSPGPHKVVVSRPGYATHAEEVDLSPGKSEKLEISLERS